MAIINISESEIPIQQLRLSMSPERKQIAGTDLLRLDLLHPVISGNKWFKLKYNIEYALQHKYTSLLTFGGAYSNHLVATAAAAKTFGLKSVGMVRGLHAAEQDTPTLQQCRDMGMELHFVSREAYRLKNDPKWLQELSEKFTGVYIIPEGGNNELGKKGVGEIASYIPEGYTHIAVSVGSGTTFTGLREALPESVTLLGFVPMKQGADLANELHPAKGNWLLLDAYHFGGFGKYNQELIDFMNAFYQIHRVPLDLVYTAKMMYGVQQLQLQGYFPPDAKVLCIHTGGLQGNAGIAAHLSY